MQCDLKTKGAILASEIISQFGTSDVYEIAGRSGLKIVYERWHPLTIGEIDVNAKLITINENAVIPFEKIIAHELGHYFLKDADPKNEESICDDFAERLLNK